MICNPHCTGAEKERGEIDDSKLSLQVVANLGISGVQAGASGDLVFVRAVKEDMRNSGVGMQTEVRRVVLPLTALDLLQSIRMHKKAAPVAVCRHPEVIYKGQRHFIMMRSAHQSSAGKGACCTVSRSTCCMVNMQEVLTCPRA